MKLRALIEQACTCSTMHGGGGLKVRARLCFCLWHSRWRVLAAMTRHLQVVCLCCDGAAVKLRALIEQACTCSTMHGGGGLKVRARLCLWHSDGECLPP